MKFSKKFALILFLIFLLSFSKIAFSEEEKPLKIGSQIGNLAPDFVLKDLSGKTWKSSDFKGKIIFLNFWASWCPPCRSEIPSIEKLSKIFDKKDFVVVTVAFDDSIESLKKFIKKNDISFLVLKGEQNLINLYQIQGIPLTLIIDREGIIVQREVGAKDWSSEKKLEYFKNLIQLSKK